MPTLPAQTPRDEAPAGGPPRHVEFIASADEVDVYGIFEVTARVVGAVAAHPFVATDLRGEFGLEEDERRSTVLGFCDSLDGAVFRIRFMPQAPGEHTYSVRYRDGDFVREHRGSFTARDGGRPGPLRVDPDYRWHLRRGGADRPFFWNGATALFLAGWEEREIAGILDRYRRLRVNVIRVLLSGCASPRPWGTPVVPTESFSLSLEPWVRSSESAGETGGYDLTRFDVQYWRRFERLLALATERELVVSVALFLGGQEGGVPFAPSGADERRFFRYAVARLGAFACVVWDLGHEHDLSREYPQWADSAGYTVKAADPYGMLLGAHNRAYRTSDSAWTDVQFLQRWGDGQYAFLLEERRRQERTGRELPQISAGYGYEDQWESHPGERSADQLRRLAWEICMAGGYATAGESVRLGTGVEPDSGGGWVNGRGDDTMQLLDAHAALAEFFTSFDWWQAQPRQDLVKGNALCLALPGSFYAMYLPAGGRAQLRLDGGFYRVRRFHPGSGEWTSVGPAAGPIWNTPDLPDDGDWAVLVVRRELLPESTPLVMRAGAISPDGRLVRILFDQPLSPSAIATPELFSIEPHGRVLGAEIDPDHAALARLRMDGLRDGYGYSISAGDAIDPRHQRGSLDLPLVLRLRFVEVPEPVVAFGFDAPAGANVLNRGNARVTHPQATVTPLRPARSGNVATPFSGAGSVDFGSSPGPHAIQLGESLPEALARISSFTFCAWVNVRILPRDEPGSCLLSTFGTSATGLAIDVTPRGELRLAIGDAREPAVAWSSLGVLAEDLRGRRENWVFVAAVWDEPAGRVEFYVGSADEPAVVDRRLHSRSAVLEHGPGAVVSVGHLAAQLRLPSNDGRCFLGLLDEVAIHASPSDSSGALSSTQIRALQQVTAPASEDS